MARMTRFIIHEVIHERGRFFVPESELAKHLDLCSWDGKGHGYMDTINKNFEDEKRKQNAIPHTWPKDDAGKTS